MMRAATWLVLLISVFSRLEYSQTFPVAEGYLGFTVLNNEYGTDRQNSPGVQLGFGYNVTRNLRLVTDFGAQSHSTNIVWTNGRRASADSYQLLFGPELTLRSSPSVTPFFHGMVGVAFRNYAVPTGNWICTGYSCYEDTFSVARETGFASAVGGGIDWHFHSVMSYRVVQFDWIRTNLSRDNLNFSPLQGQLPTLSGWQNNYRFSCGVILRFGRKGSSK